MKTTKKTICISHNKEPYFREIEAHVFVMNGVDLALNPKSEKWEFTHVLSGMGFNGDGSRTLKGIEKSIEALEKRMGKRKAWSLMKKQKTLGAYIVEQKQIASDNIRRKKDWETLSKTLGFTPALDGLITWASNKITLDVLKLENQLSYRFGSMKDRSMSEVITENYGKETAEMVKSLL